MSFITDIDFDRVVNYPVTLPQTEVRAGETIVMAVLALEAQKKADVAWLGLHVHRLAPSLRSSNLVHGTQADKTVTTNEAYFTQEDVGAVIRWSAAPDGLITAFVNATTVTVAVSQTVAPSYFELIGSSPKRINSSFGVLYVGVYSNQFARLNRPTGDPLYYLTLDGPGSLILPPRSRRVIYGPDLISVAVTNNTSNVNVIEAVVTGCIKAYV